MPVTSTIIPADSPTDLWQQIVAPYQTPHLRRSLWQVVNSIVPFLGLWVVMYQSLQFSYWLTLALAIPAAGFNVRIFILLHDCGHGSFFRSQKANNFLGIIAGFLTLTPYFHWRHDHAVHHATACDLGRRGVGDVKTLTVEEYGNASRREQFVYRVYRNPFVLFGLAPLIKFLIVHRFPRRTATKRERRSVHWTNLFILAIVILASRTIGIEALLMVHLPILAIGSSVGIWLFYVQHQFEEAHWQPHKNWDYVAAAMHGSSFYKLPRILQWFTGNIGYHHIHHLSPRIPNYYLEKCYDENPAFQEVQPVTILSSLKSVRSRLWDSDLQKFVGYNHARRVQNNATTPSGARH